jgi:hypothetical protein
MVSFEYNVGDKVTVTKTISTVNGTLYKDTAVKITGVGFPDKDLEVKDPTGQLWYLNYEDVRLRKE